MVLRGDLKSLNLANVLQDLAQNGQTGTLDLRVGDRRRFLWFEKGVLRLVGLGASHGPSILNGLLAMGKITRADLGPAVNRQGEGAILRALQKKGSIAEEAVKAALQEQMSELLCDAFLWTDAEFEFIEGDPEEDNFDVRQLDWEIRMACDPIIMEALRRIDEWAEIKKVVISVEEIFQQVAPPDEKQADAVTMRIYSLFDGDRRLRDIIHQTHLGHFTVFKSASMLLRLQAIKPLAVADAQARANEHIAGARWEEALRLTRYALEHERHSPELRRMAGQALEELGKPEEAATEYRTLLAELVEQGRKQDAVLICRKIVTLAPRDTFTQEKLFQLLLDLGSAKEALAQGESLAAALKRTGMPDRARAVYEALVTRFNDNEDIIEGLAEIVRQMGDKKEAIVLYRKLFDKALARGDEELVVQRSRTLLRLDPSLEDVAKRRLDVETGMYRRNLARRQKAKWLTGAGIALAILALIVIHELRARGILADARSQTLNLVEKHDYAAAVRLYNEIVERVGWTFVSSEARKEREDLERRLAANEFPRAEKLDEGEKIGEALGTVDAVLDLSKLEETTKQGEALKKKFREHQGKVENAFLEKALKMAAMAREGKIEAYQDILELTHPLAVPALRALMEDKSPAVRKAAILVLGKIGSEDALDLLVKTMARDAGDADLRKETETQLKLVSGVDLGSNAQEWEAWLLKRGKRPIQGLILAPKPRVAIGEKVAIEWRIVNVGAASVDFNLPAEFGPVFRVLDPAGTALKVLDANRKIEDRTVRLRPGEFVGGVIQLKEAAEGVDLPGVYKVSWAARVKWGAGLIDLLALPITVEILPRQ